MSGNETADLAEVPEDQRLDEDGGEGSDATGDGGPEEDFSDLYADPGEVIEEDIG